MQNASPRKLTAAQQAILEEHLEETFRNIERDYNKRTDPDSPIPTVDILLTDRLSNLLNLILAIPSIHPTAYLQIAFLLRFTSSAREWIVGYPLIWPSGYGSHSQDASESKQEDPTDRTVGVLLDFLRLLDDGWRRVLVAPKSGIIQEGSPPQSMARPGLSLTATEKIRLRSSIMSLRQTLLQWIDRYRKRRTDGKRSGGPVSAPARNHSPNVSTQSSSVVSPEPSEESDTGMSPGIVEEAMDGMELENISGRPVEDEEVLEEWEIAIANSMSGTLELVL